MRYFKAIEKPTKPFITWHSWANSLQELTQMQEQNNPLILPETQVPAFEFGVCPLKIVNGGLEQRTTVEMEQFELEYTNLLAQKEIEFKRKELKELFTEIAFAAEIGEDTTAMEAVYNQKLTVYNNLMNS